MKIRFSKFTNISTLCGTKILSSGNFTVTGTKISGNLNKINEVYNDRSSATEFAICVFSNVKFNFAPDLQTSLTLMSI